MKHLLLSILIIYSTDCISQDVNPDLFQTWYLYSTQASDADNYYTVSEVTPSITPYLTILDNLDFNGVVACNSFEGTFSLTLPDPLTTTQFSNSANDCSTQTQNDIEDSFFSIVDAVSYFITTEENGMILNINTRYFGMIVLKNFKLNTLDFDLNQIKIYTNPTTSMVYIKSQNESITKIELFNLKGQSMKTINNNFKTINISDLSYGIYIIKIFTELGTLNKKIYKK